MRSRRLSAAFGVGLLIAGVWGLGRWYPALTYRFQAPCGAHPCVDMSVVALVLASGALALIGVELICYAAAAGLRRSR